MAIRLQNKDNVTAPGGSYPYGNIKDDTGGNNGTPVNVKTYADFHQFFARILDLGGVVGNDLPENSVNGFQYIVALINIIVAQATTLVNAEAALRTAADTTLQNNINTEITNRTNAVSSEASTRSAADTTLQNNINAEASTRGADDTSLQNQIDALNANHYVDDRTLGTGGGSQTVLTIPTTANKSILVEVEFLARWVSGSTSIANGGMQKKSAMFRNSSGVLTQVGATQTITTVTTDGSTPTISFGISGSDIIVQLSPGSGEEFRTHTVAYKRETT